MKKILTYLFLILFVQLSYSQQIQMPQITIDAIYLGRGKKISPIEYYSHYFIINEGYKYKIRVRMNFPKDYIPNFLQYGIVCILPDFKVKKLNLNPKNILQYSPKEFDYTFRLKVINNGWLRIFVAQKNDFYKDTDVRFYDSTSNKANIFLSTVLK